MRYPSMLPYVCLGPNVLLASSKIIKVFVELHHKCHVLDSDIDNGDFHELGYER